jgi:hypothetical protein
MSEIKTEESGADYTIGAGEQQPEVAVQAQPAAASTPKGMPRATKTLVATETLSNGAVAKMRRTCGADLVRAGVLSGVDGTEMAFLMALVSVVTSVDGMKITYEDMKEAPGEDVTLLTGTLGKYLGTAPATS